VLSFSAQTTARWAHVGIGLIVAVLAGLRLWFMHRTPQRVSAQR
jgi:cytochrome b561